MMRTFLLWLSEQQGVFNFLRRNGLARRFAARFVAGETSETATAAALELKTLGITASLDLLGESVTRDAEAVAARDEYLRMLDRLAASGAEVNVSVKLTQMGLDIDEALCADNMRRILDRARELGGFVRLDMEGSAYTQRTLDFFERHLLAEFGSTPAWSSSPASAARRGGHRAAHRARGPRAALQGRLPRAARGRVSRQGATWTGTTSRLMERLLRRGNYPALATHDEPIIEHARAFVTREGIPAERFEFQMLYGVRRDLQERLREGRLQHAGLHPLRHPVVSLPHAPPGRAAGQHRLHPRQRGAGDARPAGLMEATLGGYMAKHERAAAFGGSDGQRLLGRPLRGRRAGRAGPLRRGAPLRALGRRGRRAGRPRRDRVPRLGAHRGGGGGAAQGALALRREGRARRGHRRARRGSGDRRWPAPSSSATARPTGSRPAQGEVRAVLSGQAPSATRRRSWWATWSPSTPMPVGGLLSITEVAAAEEPRSSGACPLGRGTRPIAANIDPVFVVTANRDPAPVPQLIDRLLVVAEANEIRRRRRDQQDRSRCRAAWLERGSGKAGYQVFRTSAKTGEGLEALRGARWPGRDRS